VQADWWIIWLAIQSPKAIDVYSLPWSFSTLKFDPTSYCSISTDNALENGWELDDRSSGKSFMRQVHTTLPAISDAWQRIFIASFNTSQNALAASLWNERAVSWTPFATLLRSPASTFIGEACARSSDHQEDVKEQRVVTSKALYEAGQKMYLRGILGRRTLKLHYYVGFLLDCYHLTLFFLRHKRDHKSWHSAEVLW
jgi:hypothetical protein